MPIANITFIDPKSQSMWEEGNCKWLQYTVVNDPQEPQTFETLPQLINSHQDNEITLLDAIPREHAARDVITMPDFRVIYSYYNDADNPESQLLKHELQQSPEYAINVNNVYQYLVDAHEAGIPLVYTKQFFTTIAGEVDCVWTKDDNTEWRFRSRHDDPERHPLSKVNNIPIMPSAKGRPRSYEGCVTLCFMPHKFGERMNFTTQTDDIYKFDVYTLAAGDSIQSKVFSDSTEGYFHVGKGSVEVDGTSVNFQEFYKQDPTTPATIASTEDAFVVYIVKVPSI